MMSILCGAAVLPRCEVLIAVTICDRADLAKLQVNSLKQGCLRSVEAIFLAPGRGGARIVLAAQRAVSDETTASTQAGAVAADRSDRLA